MERIKKCPFCGGEADYMMWDNESPPFRVICEKGHALDHWEDNLEEAIDIWNMRKTDDKSKAKGEPRK